MVIRALNVWTSSAKIGCLGLQLALPTPSVGLLGPIELGDAQYSLLSVCSGIRRTLSCPARRRQSSYGPMCRRCSCAHASLARCKLRMRARGVDVRFGAVSSMLVALRILMASSDSCLDGVI